MSDDADARKAIYKHLENASTELDHAVGLAVQASFYDAEHDIRAAAHAVSKVLLSLEDDEEQANGR